MTRWQLVPETGGPPIDLPEGRTLVLGRSVTSDIHLADETVSRQHAELYIDGTGLLVRDLASANGTLHNDAPLAEGRVVAGDVLSFGRLRFALHRNEAPAPAVPWAEEPGSERGDDASVRAVDVHSGGGTLARIRKERLARLISLARRLGGESDGARLPALVVEQTAALLPADRVALLVAEDGGLRLAHWINRLGRAPVQAPGTILRRAMEERVPVVSDNATDDRRFQSSSIVTDQVRGALCVPLLTERDELLGLLYVDSLTRTAPFSDEEAALCFAFGGLAAASIAQARTAAEARRQEVVRTNFERFFAPGVAERIAATRSDVRPGGERRPVTVLFSDVRGFTGLAETLAPETVARHLSDYFSAMVDLVFEHGGTLDKFMGDALLAVWGAPVAMPDDVDRALAAARAMQEELHRLNQRWVDAGRPPLHAGIGLHYGEAFAGTIGSPRRLEYTVIGDVVNVAYRLCQTAAPGEILISEAVRSQLVDQPALRSLDPLALKGREERVRVFSLGPRA